MLNPQANKDANDRSFLPEDYLERRFERRTNIFSLTLFAVVMVGVVGAFLVTNRQWNDVRRYQEAINVRYSQAAKDIEQLKMLESQKGQLMEKAELTTALIERVPRSILLAELINRMPTDITLLELEMKSTRITDKAQPKDGDASGKPAAKAKSGGSAKTARSSKDGAPEEPKGAVTPPRFQTKVILVGVTTTHDSVARYVAMLQKCPLLTNIDLKFSEKTIIRDRDMYKFRIEADIRKDADARRIEPLANPRANADGPEAQPPVLPRKGTLERATAEAHEREGGK